MTATIGLFWGASLKKVPEGIRCFDFESGLLVHTYIRCLGALDARRDHVRFFFALCCEDLYISAG
jgi:hypothetical protein